jgi:hypothetical protein
VTAQYTLNTAIEDVKDELSIKIYPNPAKDILYIEVQDINLFQNPGVGITIINSIGIRIYQSHNIETKQTIDLNKYPKGIYFVTIGNETRKILIE